MEGEGVGFDEGEIFVASDRKTDGADTGIEVENMVSGDMLFDGAEGEFVDWKVNLEEAVGRIRVSMAEELVGERGKNRVRVAVFIKTARNFAGLISAEKERLVFASFLVASVEVVDNRRGGSKNFRAFERGLGNRKLTARTAGMEGELDFRGIIVPIERILHFVAIEIGVVVGVDGGGGDNEMMFAENFGDEFGLELIFVIPIDDLPR